MQKKSRFTTIGNWFYLSIGFFVFIRLALSAGLPDYLLPDMIHDDGWMLRRAISILEGNWLGAYDQYILIKGAFSPMFLAFSSYVGFSFSMLNAVLYSVACVVFVFAIQPVIKKRWILLFVFVLLLFNPITYALHTDQRVYRIGMGQWQIVFIFSCLMAVYFRRQNPVSDLLKWLLLGGIVLGAFLQTREDGVWIYPFLLGTIVITSIVYFIESKSYRKIPLFFLPILVALIFNMSIAGINFAYYGGFVLNDRNAGSFAKVAGDLYAMSPDEGDVKLYNSSKYKGQYYNIYVSTINKALEISPTLKSIEPSLRDSIRAWGGMEEYKTGELSTDHMIFALRDAAKAAGYYRSLHRTELFFSKIHSELQSGFNQGLIKKHGLTLSPLVEPMSFNSFIDTIKSLPATIKKVISFDEVTSSVLPSTGADESVRRFSMIAGSEYIEQDVSVIGLGWFVAKNDQVRPSLRLYDGKGLLIAEPNLIPSLDVYNHFCSTESCYKNAKVSRFKFNADGYRLSNGLVLKVFDNEDAMIISIDINGSKKCSSNKDYAFCMDREANITHEYDFYSQYVSRANIVSDQYRSYSVTLGSISLIVYLVMSLMLFVKFLRRQGVDVLSVWLPTTGVLVSFMFFMFILTFISVTSFDSRVYWYMAPAYILYLIFISLSLGWGVRFIEDVIKGNNIE